MYETERLVLRHPVFEDWKGMYRNVWCHEETARYMLWSVTTSEDDAMERMNRSILFQKDRTAWFVYEKTTGEPIGFAGFCPVAEGIFEDTGIALGPEYVGKGYGTELLNQLTAIAKAEYNAAAFIATCRSQNEASRKLILKCGFNYTHSEPRTDPRDGSCYTLEFYRKELSGTSE